MEAFRMGRMAMRSGQRMMRRVAAGIIGLATLIPILSAGQESFDAEAEVQDVLTAVSEVLDRLEFDTDRLSDPPAHILAINAMVWNICAAATVGSDISGSFTADYMAKVSGNLEYPGPWPDFWLRHNVFYMKSGRFDIGLGLGSQVTKRWCINIVPWFVERLRDHHSEVFAGANPQSLDLRDRGDRALRADLLDRLSDDSRAFIAVASELVLGDIDAESWNAVDAIDLAVARLKGGGDLTAAGVQQASNHLTDAVSKLQGIDFTSPLGWWGAYEDFVHAIGKSVPFLPPPSFMTAFAHNPSFGWLNPCPAVSSDQPIAQIPLVYEALDTMCEVQGVFLHATGGWVEDARETLEPFWSEAGGEITYGLVEIGHFISLGVDQLTTLRTRLVEVGSNAVQTAYTRLLFVKSRLDSIKNAIQQVISQI